MTDDRAVEQARDSLIRLLQTTARIAQDRQWNRLNEFFVNSALHELTPLPPFTD